MEIEKELQKFDMPTAVIEKMAEQYLPLKIKDLTDKEGYKTVREARLIVKEKRVGVEKRRKELKEDSLKFGKAVDAEARRITALLEPIESHLEAQEGWWDAEKERLKQEAIKQDQEKLQARIDALRQYNCSIPVVALQVMDDTDFEWTLESVKAEYEAAEKEKQEAKRLEAERLSIISAEQEAERLRLEAITRAQAETGRIQAEKEDAIKAEQDRLVSEKKAIDDLRLAEERERVRLQELEVAQVAAAKQERARIEQESEREWLEEERQKALLPEKEKLMAWALEIRRVSLTVPTLTDVSLREATHVALDRINEGIDHIIGVIG